ncbi:MAG: alanine racemase, partial [Bacteroidetes bacterium]|nr:alanine racemase [Bacteroidota bacterium]
HPTRALINLESFHHNIGVVRKFIGEKVGIIAVVKANAYGHGMELITKEAVKNGVSYLGVARVTEGIDLRKTGFSVPILLFEIIPPEYVEQGVVYSLDMTVCTIEEAKRIESVAERLKRKARIHVNVDTGAAEFVEQVARMKWLDIAAIYSHFATSEDPDQTFAKEQLKRFQTVLDELNKRRIEIPLKHMANTGAIMSLPESHFDLVRPGFMMYGYTPRKGMDTSNQLKPVMSIVAKVSLLKKVEKGTSISYGRKYIAPYDTHIATVPIGYGDGYSRMLTGKSDVIIRGKRYPVAGAVTMDHIMVDVGAKDEVEVGDNVTIMGSDGRESISAYDIADRLGTIPYEVICMVTDRVPRVVV